MEWPWSKSTPTLPRKAPKLYTLSLLHDFGHDIEIPNIPEADLAFIRDNLGRDRIYDLDHYSVNLQRFSFAKYCAQETSVRTKEAPVQ